MRHIAIRQIKYFCKAVSKHYILPRVAKKILGIAMLCIVAFRLIKYFCKGTSILLQVGCYASLQKPHVLHHDNLLYVMHFQL